MANNWSEFEVEAAVADYFRMLRLELEGYRYSVVGIPHVIAEPRPIYNPAGVNYLEREARNEVLGEAGEKFVINYERARLIHTGKESLADRIEQVSATIGPAAGYDIRSFEENGRDRFIETKTTKYGKETPFFITPSEVCFSRENAASYYLYRLFGFRESPRLFTLHGRVEDRCILEPSEFIARPA